MYKVGKSLFCFRKLEIYSIENSPSQSAFLAIKEGGTFYFEKKLTGTNLKESGTEPRMTEPRKTEPRKTERRMTERRMTKPRKTEPRKTERRMTERQMTEHRKGPNIERPNLEWDRTSKD